MELDYTVFMYATQLNNIDNMLPSHNDRIAFLFASLRSTTVLTHQEEETVFGAGSQEVLGAPRRDGGDWAVDIAMGFEQTADQNLPEIIGHKGRLLYSPRE